ncbi:MAG: tRNA wybutosine-synthesizing protein 1 [Methanohalophilus sp.]|nr:tRNA wybutosine-synthesizing protein 1 [Methanohalophilus sp.]
MPETWDSPMEIVMSSIKSQQKLISGFGGSASRDLWEEANEPAHVAISLSGEPTIYPYLPELVEEFRNKGLSTFVVTNGTNPHMMERISPSQLYISLDAPDVETYEKVCNPMLPGLWENINKSLDIVRKKDCRTAIRITLVKGVNMFNPEGYASLIKKAEPDFVEIKAYMHLGFSRRRLERDAMPTHDEVEEFALEVARVLGYTVADSVPISRIVLLSKEAECTKMLPL